MKTSLAYIDDVMDRAIEAEHVTPTVPKADRDKATEHGRKLIGGFRVRDEAAERAALDDMIAKRRESIQRFRDDRLKVRTALKALGVTPLAVCPTGAWYKVCRDTGLFVLSPDRQARVGYSRIAFNDFTGKSAEKNVDGFAKGHWPEVLKRMFPDGLSLASDPKATLILPDPPAEVADILCKAQSLTLTVAAIPEAIRFAEKPSELMKNARANPKDLWAQAQGYEDYADWLKRDPIIFTEHGTAAAIIAQFGDFPIEKDVVDAATKSDDLIADRPRPIEQLSSTYVTYTDPGDMYRAQILEAWNQSRQDREIARMRQRDEEQRLQFEMRQRQRMIEERMIADSRSWTGR